MPDPTLGLCDTSAGRSLAYRGGGWYTATLNDTVQLELSYDGSDYMVGDWVLADLVIDGKVVCRVNDLLSPDSELVRWLEDEARKDGHLPNEPEGAIREPV